MLKTAVILMLSLLISSCASYYSNNGEQTYLQSRNGPNLVVPPPLTDSNLSGFYVLPPQTENPRVSIAPPQE